MSFKLKRTEKIGKGIRRIATEQIAKAVCEIDEAGTHPHATVHQVRKRLKMLRGLIRLARPALGNQYGVANDTFRDTAKVLSSTRDAHSIIGTLDNLVTHFRSQLQPNAFGSIRDTLSRRRNEISDEEIKQRLADVRQTLLDSRDRVQDWKLSPKGFSAIRDGIAKTHQRAAAYLEDALDDSDTEVLHQLRKHVKYHGYHARLLCGVWPVMMAPYAAALKDLGDNLGKDHDLAVLRTTVLSSHEDFGSKIEVEAFAGLLEQYRERNSAAAIADAERVFAEPTEKFTKRLKAYWKIWR